MSKELLPSLQALFLGQYEMTIGDPNQCTGDEAPSRVWRGFSFVPDDSARTDKTHWPKMPHIVYNGYHIGHVAL